MNVRFFFEKCNTKNFFTGQVGEWARRNDSDILVTLLHKGSKVKPLSFLGAKLYICVSTFGGKIYFLNVYFKFHNLNLFAKSKEFMGFRPKTLTLRDYKDLVARWRKVISRRFCCKISANS